MDNYFKCINFGKVKCIVCDHLSYVQILVPLVEHLTGDSMNLGSNHILVSHDFSHPITFGAVANPWNRQVYSFQRMLIFKIIEKVEGKWWSDWFGLHPIRSVGWASDFTWLNFKYLASIPLWEVQVQCQWNDYKIMVWVKIWRSTLRSYKGNSVFGGIGKQQNEISQLL